MAAAPVNPDDYRMSFGEHLEDLRFRLIRAVGGVMVAAILTFYFGRDMISWLAEPLNRAQVAAGLPPQTITPNVTAGFFIYIKISLIGAVIIAAPWVMYQMWKFVEAGLYSHERKVVYVLAPFSSLMTLMAVAFMYYVMLPVTLAFLLFFAVSFGPSGGQSKDPLAFLSKYVSSFAGSDSSDGEGKWMNIGTVGQQTLENPVFFELQSNLRRPGPRVGSDWLVAGAAGYRALHAKAVSRGLVGPESFGPTADLTKVESGFGRIPEFDADPPFPDPGQMWVNRRENALKVRVDNRTLVAYLAVSSLVSPLIDLQQYIDFVLFMTLGIVIAFQMPVGMTVLGWTGIVQAALLRRFRKHMFFVCFCMGAIITPSSDPLSMTLMAMPLYLLFELGLLIMHFTQRPMRLVADADEFDEDDDDDDDTEDDEEDIDDDEDEDEADEEEEYDDKEADDSNGKQP